MDSERLRVLRVDGRYPHRAKFCPENIEASITQLDGIMRVRLDDPSAPDFWLEIVLVVEAAES